MSESASVVYLMVQGTEKGPVTLDEVRTMLSAGLITPDTMCKKTEEWQALVNAMSGASRQSQPGGRCFLSVRDEEKGPFTFDQVRSVWNAGQITADTTYRMTEIWQPLLRVLPHVSTQAPPISDGSPPVARRSCSVVDLLLPRGRMDKGKCCLVSLGSLFAFAAIWYLVNSITEGKGQLAESIASIGAFLMLVGWAWFGLALTAKRFHDLSLSGWFAPLIFVPVAWVILCILSGTKAPNKYGPAPN